MRRLFLAAFALAVALAVPSASRAEGRPTQLADHRPNAKATALELELGFFTHSLGSVRLTALTPHFDLRHAFSAHSELTIDWPLEFDILSGSGPDKGGSIASGNPSAAFYYMSRNDNGYFRVGGALGVPLAPHELSGALFTNGMRDVWSYLPKSFSLFVPAQFELQRGALVLGADLAGGVIIPTESAAGTTQPALQLGGIVGAHVGKTTLGTRLQGTWLPKSPGVAQTALVPFVQGDFNDGGFLYARLTLNLDPPYGFFGGANYWGFIVGGGSRM